MRRIVLLLVLGLIPVASAAQQQTPEEISKAYFEALKRSDWKAVAGYFTPEAQKRFRGMMASVFDIGKESVQNETRRALMGELTKEQISKLSDAEFVEKILGALMGRALAAGAQFKRVEVVGSVVEKPGLNHVVTRFFVGVAGSPEVEIEKMAVLSFEKGSKGWGLTLSGDMKGMVASIKSRILAVDKAPEKKPPN